MTKRLTKSMLVILVLVLLIGCDHASKGYAKAELETGGARELISGFVNLQYVENKDIAFNLLRWVPEAVRFPALLVSGAVAVVALCLLLLRARERFRVPMFAALLVTAGAVGNYLDRVFRGYVVDFVHVWHWPVFNVADVYLTLGFAFFAWSYFVDRRHSPALALARNGRRHRDTS